MRRTVSLSKRAREDLIELGRWLAEQADVTTAIGYVRRIRSHCDDLADFPHRGTLRPSFGRGVRSITHGPRLILYRVSARTVRILRIVHGSRNLADLPLD